MYYFNSDNKEIARALEKYVTESEVEIDVKEKLRNSEKLVNQFKFTDKKNHFKHIRAVFRETYTDSLSYKRNKASSIIKKHFNNDPKMKVGQFEFMMMKYMRGIFREENWIDFFEQFHTITTIVNRSITDSYYTLSYSKAMTATDKILSGFLNIFINLGIAGSEENSVFSQ